MTDIFAGPPTPVTGLTGSPLDRADHLRRDPAALIALRADPSARWLAFAELKPLLAEDAGLVWHYRSDIPHDATSVLLGLDTDGSPRFAAALSTAAAADLPGVATDARQAGMTLVGSGDPGRAAIIAHGRTLLHWHARHSFCANCGAPTRLEKGGAARRCDSCSAEHFPRLDPVVIMLALYRDHALVGRGPHFPPGFLSALAGFVEPGESLEEAVARELREEAGLVIGRVRYLASQPWPFPSSLMIAAFAEAGSAELALDPDEIVEARWITRDEARAALAGRGDFLAPPPLAIAHTLLSRWIET